MPALIKNFKTTSFRDGGSGSLFLKSCLEELELFVYTPPLYGIGDHRLQVQAQDSRLGNGKLPSCPGFQLQGPGATGQGKAILALLAEESTGPSSVGVRFASWPPIGHCLPACDWTLRRGDGSSPGPWPLPTPTGSGSGSHSLLSVLGGAPGRGGPMPIRAFNDAINALWHNASTREPNQRESPCSPSPLQS